MPVQGTQLTHCAAEVQQSARVLFGTYLAASSDSEIETLVERWQDFCELSLASLSCAFADSGNQYLHDKSRVSRSLAPSKLSSSSDSSPPTSSNFSQQRTLSGSALLEG